MDLSLTQEQEMLRASIRALCEDHFTPKTVRACEIDPNAAAALKSMWSDLGFGALLLPEPLGGLGLGLTDAVVVQQELGRALAPLSMPETDVPGLTILTHAAELHGIKSPLAALIAGRLSVACLWSAAPDDTFEACTLKHSAGSFSVTGKASYIATAPGLSTHLLAPARTDEGAPTICLIEAAAPGVHINALPNLADVPLADVTFSGAAALVLTQGEEARGLWSLARDRMLIALAAQAVGGAERALEIAVDYAKTREQFGQPIGSFQAIAHYLADAAVNVEGARVLTFRAAAAADANEAFSIWAAMAKLKASKTFRDVSALSIQIHGGIGFTLEADPQLFYRRAKHLQLFNGDPMDLEDRIGEAVASAQHKVLQS